MPLQLQVIACKSSARAELRLVHLISLSRLNNLEARDGQSPVEIATIIIMRLI